MPSKSAKQARFMAMVAHDPAAARRVGVPQSVGLEFNRADAGTGILHAKSVHKRVDRLHGKHPLYGHRKRP